MNLHATECDTEPVVGEFLPPPYEDPHVLRQFQELIARVSEAIMPVWPLKDYIAVNPLAGLSERSFGETREYLRIVSDCETLMPLAYYAEQFVEGELGIAEIEAALSELAESEEAGQTPWTVEQVVQTLQDAYAKKQGDNESPVRKRHRIRTMAETCDASLATSWQETIVDEISKHLAAHYDEGQATWKSPWKDLTLFQAWRSAASKDLSMEIAGLPGFREYVSSLPGSARSALLKCLSDLRIPRSLWESFLLCQALSIPGWAAWTRYQDQQQAEVSDADHFLGLLAIRLAYDAGLGRGLNIQFNWGFYGNAESAVLPKESAAEVRDARLRQLLLRATEIRYRETLLGSLSPAELSESVDRESAGETVSTDRKLAQLAFCIDVRSERFRRNLERVSDEVETFGVAGFFGMPIESIELGGCEGDHHVPALLKPSLRVRETLSADAQQPEPTTVESRQRCRDWRALWQSFQTSAVGCFSFVETTGLWYGVKFAKWVLGFPVADPSEGRWDGIHRRDRDKVALAIDPTDLQTLGEKEQVQLAASMLGAVGLKSDFARLVVLCGHASQSANNPLAAALDCGACGGHSGEPNARLAAMLLNRPEVRRGLSEQGIEIPEDTCFVAALHNTTTDQLEFFDQDSMPSRVSADLDQLKAMAEQAGLQTRQERHVETAAQAGESSNADTLVQQLATDWSEVRPEWGLAGNAGFVAGPRSWTRGANLDGRSFLHSYDHRQDEDGTVLETIMTAPMVVAHWINMQYYASVADHGRFGSGSKAVHNVVGQFGILSGNGGDLKTGMAWQSIHNGKRFQHHPLRLQSVIVAPREKIQAVIDTHAVVRNLLAGGWMHLIAIDQGRAFRYGHDGRWRSLGDLGRLQSDTQGSQNRRERENARPPQPTFAASDA
ncbi:DUF2309 domain-containing protein [Roseiconus nitratireducens]|uniref:Probable inorganic carbon transporter subunit DabA n=1 Tax=Roseiconus nitratireducens TaxID=2605748 RepID=A0A5M6DIP9_9BACT|nr:DUF2309 domain-containing protein [Roseiconus nitratireducens]KAA5546110.1 DUF2309 domain-containing protein [Roseiconus nitratireducens]